MLVKQESLMFFLKEYCLRTFDSERSGVRDTLGDVIYLKDTVPVGKLTIQIDDYTNLSKLPVTVSYLYDVTIYDEISRVATLINETY